jgi:hypothetical protein
LRLRVFTISFMNNKLCHFGKKLSWIRIPNVVRGY